MFCNLRCLTLSTHEQNHKNYRQVAKRKTLRLLQGVHTLFWTLWGLHTPVRIAHTCEDCIHRPCSHIHIHNCAQFVFACASPSFLSWTCYKEASVLNATHPPSVTFLSLNPLFILFSVLTPFSLKSSPQIILPGPSKCHLPVFKGSSISCGHT